MIGFGCREPVPLPVLLYLRGPVPVPICFGSREPIPVRQYDLVCASLCAWLPKELEPVETCNESLYSTLANRCFTLLWRVCCAPPTAVRSV